MQKKIRLTAAALAAVSVLSLSSFTSAAGEGEPLTVTESVHTRTAAASFNRYELSVSKIYNKNISAYQSVRATHGGVRISSDVRMINGVPYVAVKSFVGEISDMSVSYNSKTKVMNVKGQGFEMDVIDGGNIVYANGRCLFSMTPSALMKGDVMYAPLNVIAKALGLGYSYNAEGGVTLSGAVKPIMHGSRYYAEDAVYWLSRIISAESRGESLLGQIAVGSVVMNRVKSNQYPNTIWGVIFDRKYGVQFSPIIDGSIYMSPTATSVVAAKICLEGFNVNKDALFFLYPKYSTSSWIPNNRQYLFSIGKHDFYA